MKKNIFKLMPLFFLPVFSYSNITLTVNNGAKFDIYNSNGNSFSWRLKKDLNTSLSEDLKSIDCTLKASSFVGLIGINTIPKAGETASFIQNKPIVVNNSTKGKTFDDLYKNIYNNNQNHTKTNLFFDLNFCTNPGGKYMGDKCAIPDVEYIDIDGYQFNTTSHDPYFTTTDKMYDPYGNIDNSILGFQIDAAAVATCIAK